MRLPGSVTGTVPNAGNTAVTVVAKQMGKVESVANAVESGLLDAVVSEVETVKRVGNELDAIKAVEAISVYLPQLASNLDNLEAVVANLGGVLNCSNNMATLLLVHARMGELLQLTPRLPDIQRLAELDSELVSVYQSLPQLLTLASHMGEVALVGASLTQLQAIFDNLGDLVGLGQYSEELHSIGQNLDQVLAVEGLVAQAQSILTQVKQVQTAVGVDKQATEAAKVAAKTSETNAATSATQALSHKNAAATSAGVASTKASEATTAANTSVVQAGIATTKATEASNSAASALASKNAAAAVESTVLAAANTASTNATAAIAAKEAAQTSEASALASKNAAANSEAVAQSSIALSSASATTAVEAKNSAAVSASDALASKNTAVAEAAKAVSEATKAKASADSAAAVVTGGTATLTPTAGKIPLADGQGKIHEGWAPAPLFGMTQAQFEAIRASNNEEFAASGFVHLGKAYVSPPIYTTINHGMWTAITLQNLLVLGPTSEGITNAGTSKTDFAVANIAGVLFDIKNVNYNYSTQSRIKFPPEPDGKTTYNKSTGVIFNYATMVAPRYGDVAATSAEAVARAFEGEVKYGDFRGGNNAFIPSNGSTVTLSNGVLSCVSTASSNQLAQQTGLNFVSGTTYRVTMKNVTSNQSFTVRIGGVYTASEVQPAGAAGTDRVFTITATANATFFNIAGQGANAALSFSGISIVPVDEEVVTDRVDMWGFEAWLEGVSTTNPFVYPNGLIQSQAASMDGITTAASARPVTYYAVFDGDTGSKGKGVNFFALTDAQKKKVLGNHKNNLYYLDDGRLVQWRLRQRSFAGAGNGDWVGLASSGTLPLSFAQKNVVKGQGKKDLPAISDANWSNSVFFGFASQYGVKSDAGVFGALQETQNAAVNDELYFLVCGTVNRLNAGLYHPSHNPNGAAKALGDTFWHNTAQSFTSAANCFDPAKLLAGSGTIASAKSCRPDGRYSDAIYADGFGGVCRDMRYSANGLELIDFAEADQRVKNGTYRGFEKAVFTKPIASGYWTTSQHASKLNKYLLNYSGDNIVYINGTAAGISIGDTLIVHAPSQGLLVSIVVNRVVNVDYVSGLVATSTLHSGVMSGNGSAVTDVYLMHVKQPSTSIGGAFLQTDVIGDPANILATPQLANGWQGSWIPVIPDGTVKGFPYTRKKVAEVVSKGYAIWTTNNGASWSTGTATSSGDDAKNTFASVGFPATSIHLIPYQAFAKQTKPSANAVVYGGQSGVGGVFANSFHEAGAGGLLLESTIGKVCTDNIYTNYSLHHTLNSCSMPAGSIDKSTARAAKHFALNLITPANNSLAFKALNYNVATNQQGFINYAYTELKHNGTNWGDDSKVTIVDNQSTKTDLNGNTVLVGTAQLCESVGWIKNKL